MNAYKILEAKELKKKIRDGFLWGLSVGLIVGIYLGYAWHMGQVG